MVLVCGIKSLRKESVTQDLIELCVSKQKDMQRIFGFLWSHRTGRGWLLLIGTSDHLLMKDSEESKSFYSLATIRNLYKHSTGSQDNIIIHKSYDKSFHSVETRSTYVVSISISLTLPRNKETKTTYVNHPREIKTTVYVNDHFRVYLKGTKLIYSSWPLLITCILVLVRIFIF